MKDPFDGTTPPDSTGLRLSKVKKTAAEYLQLIHR